MAFWSSVISTILKMIFITAFAVLGVVTGKKLRENKNKKAVTETE